MNFVNTTYLPHIIAGIIFLWILLFWFNRKYFNWVKTYWFFDRSWMSRISALFYIVGISLMLISLLDLRGPEEKIKSSLPDQRTIIVIDSSASMLAEDVRPSRFVKAIQLARHFVKNAAGHQISIVLFSDIQKRLVPFTDDLDLLDSRLAALEKTNAVSGGSNISQAVSEAVQYFETEDDQKSSMGNILVFTDAEETEGGMDVDLGNSINLAVVGVGTAKGANIPMRWEDGSFRGYKNYKGEPITTKLDESFIRNMGKNVKNYKSWIANSYSLPTDEIMSFFRSSFSKTVGKGDVKVRPVFSHLILIPAIIIYCFGVLLGRFKSFRAVALILFCLCANVEKSFAEEEKQQKKLSPAVLKDLEKIKQGKAERKEILKTAEKLLKEDDLDRATELYSEYARPNDEKEVSFNQATALLKAGKLDQAMPLIQSIMTSNYNEDLKDKMRNNLLLALNNQDQQKQQNQKNKDQKKDTQYDKKDGEQKDKGDSGKNSDQSKDGKGDQDKKDKKDGKDDKSKDQKQNKPSDQDQDKDKDKDKKDKPNKDPKDLEKPERETKPQSLEEKEKMIEQKRKMVKTPAMIKQIMSDDRELQKKMMDTSTKESNSKAKRDW
jgi:Ca-activated chloride channel family protein